MAPPIGPPSWSEASAVRHSEVRLVQHPRNLGYGQALRSGFADARLDFVFYTDATTSST